jgi:hypothetical protein
MSSLLSSSKIRALFSPFYVVLILVTLLLMFIVLKVMNSESAYTKLPISCFIFRDNNRNGRYDVADRPYAGLLVKMERPDGDSISVNSNISGFANFGMLLDFDDAEVFSPGEHSIQATPADGWQISSDNESQTLNFIKMAGSPSGLVAEQTCEPIGVMPALEISGRVESDGADSTKQVQSLSAVSFEGDIIKIEYSDDGRYSFPVTQGDWQVRLLTADQMQWSRNISVKDASVEVSMISSGGSSSEPIKAPMRQVGFDDLTPSDTLFEIPNDYGQLSWLNWVATHQKLYRGSGYINSTVSSEYMAYNSSGHPAVISSDKPFDFVGVYIGVAWPPAEKDYAIIQGWRGTELVYQDKIRLSTAGSRYFDADYRSITRLVFSTEKYWQLVIDDFKYRLKE